MAKAGDAAQERAHAIFDPIAMQHLGPPGIDIGPIFGSEGLRVRGKVYAFVGRAGDLVVKLSEQRCDELVDAEGLTRKMMRRGELRQWMSVGTDAGAHRWEALMAEARDYLEEITP